METKDKQQPEMPSKPAKEKKPVALSLPLIIGGGIGALVLILATIIFGYFLATKLFPAASAGTVELTAAERAEIKKKAVDELSRQRESEEQRAVKELSLDNMEGAIYYETGRITTNPKGSSTQFVVVNLALEFKILDAENEHLQKLADKEGKLNLENPIMKKVEAAIKSSMNNTLASYTEAELQQNRGQLEKIFLDKLRPAFRRYELALARVNLLEFIIQ
ncbi:MAG: flagellar basal body-associated FliL family protein [Chloroflexota bacterium]